VRRGSSPLVKLQREPAGPTVMRVPGGPRVALLVGAVGFLATALSIGLALIPTDDEANKVLAVTKVAGLTLLLVAAGATVYILGMRRAHARV
jgi:hypothetical protein